MGSEYASVVEQVFKNQLPIPVDLIKDEEFLNWCDDQGITPLILNERNPGLIAEELLRAHEIQSVTEFLASRNVQAILLKGAALAYTAYPRPHLRPRIDTDIWIRKKDVPEAARVLTEMRYLRRVTSGFDEQSIYLRSLGFGLEHVIDLHWEISSWNSFAKTLSFEEAWSRSISVPALGSQAHALGSHDALLLACLHPVMHHYNERRAIWLYDIHLLLQGMNPDSQALFFQRAAQRRVSAICLDAIEAAENFFGTAWCSHLANDSYRRSAEKEPLCRLLQPCRGWKRMIWTDLKSRSPLAWPAQIKKILFPPPEYLFDKYKIPPHARNAGLLLKLSLRRNVTGVLKHLVRFRRSGVE